MEERVTEGGKEGKLSKKKGGVNTEGKCFSQKGRDIEGSLHRSKREIFGMRKGAWKKGKGKNGGGKKRGLVLKKRGGNWKKRKGNPIKYLDLASNPGCRSSEWGKARGGEGETLQRACKKEKKELQRRLILSHLSYV